MAQQLAAVTLVLGLLLAALWTARRYGFARITLPFRSKKAKGSGVPQLRVIERVPLTAQHSLHLVECAGRLLVVGVSPGGCNQIAQFPAAEQQLARAAKGLAE